MQMSEITEMGADSFELKGKDMPKDAAKIHCLEHSNVLITVTFEPDHNNDLLITGAWLGEDELGLSFRDYDELIAMKEVYDDNARQDIAEGGA